MITADTEVVPADSEAVAEEAGLRYVTDAEPGIRRRRAGKGFAYRDPDGHRTSASVKARIDQPYDHIRELCHTRGYDLVDGSTYQEPRA